MNKETDLDRIVESDREAPETVEDLLSEPSRALATKMLCEVTFENRFIGYKLRERAGAIPVTSYSFEEIVNLLKDQLPHINFEVMERWVRVVMGDEELADKIAEAREKGESDHERTLLVRDLAETRLKQCKALTA